MWCYNFIPSGDRINSLRDNRTKKKKKLCGINYRYKLMMSSFVDNFVFSLRSLFFCFFSFARFLYFYNLLFVLW